MKKALPEILESEYELEQLLKTEKKLRRRERLQMLYFFKTGQAETRKSAAEMLLYHFKEIMDHVIINSRR